MNDKSDTPLSDRDRILALLDTGAVSQDFPAVGLTAVDCAVLVHHIREQERRNAELVKVIEEAPHDEDCPSYGYGSDWINAPLDESKCNCWKAAALRGEGK